jgi:ceramide glucosyltransferase
VPDSLLYSGTLTPRSQNVLSSLHVPWVLVIFAAVLLARILMAASLQRRLTGERTALSHGWFVLLKDFLGIAIWAAAFLGDTIDWGGTKLRLTRGGKLTAVQME